MARSALEGTEAARCGCLQSRVSRELSEHEYAQVVANPNDLKALTTELDAYCSEHGTPEGAARDQIGRLVLDLFNSGCRTADEIKVALAENDVWRRLRWKKSPLRF